MEVYHYANEGAISWYDFANAIIDISGIECILDPIETKEYPTPAARPSYSVFNKTKFKKRFGIVIPYWRTSLKECIGNMVEYH
jgi:dTDP-4-dehydrorhamnose reductase